jgi:hypothetical protein
MMSARGCLRHKATTPRVSSLNFSLNSSLNTTLNLSTPLIQTTTTHCAPRRIHPTTSTINTDIDITMAKRSKTPKHHHQQQSASRGFMEPTAGATHREDIYGISQFEEDRVESYAFDVCDDEDDEDEEDAHGGIGETMFKRRGAISGPSSGSRGVIKKPKCKSFHLQGQNPFQTILT